MKKTVIIFSIISIFILPLTSFSQSKLTFRLTVVDLKQKPIKNLKVVFKESVLKKKITKYTDYNGNLTIELNEGAKWWMSVGKMYKYRYLEVPEYGTAEGSEHMTYDIATWEHENQPMFNRANITFTEINYASTSKQKTAADETYLRLKLSKSDKTPLRNYPVTLTDINLKKKYITKTDNNAYAHFNIPYGKTYEIDIEGIESYRFIEIPNIKGQITFKIYYDPTKIKETIKNDTISQHLSKDPESTSSRMKYDIYINNIDGEMPENENVYLNLINSKKVYIAKTDKNGKATFLLPIKKQYLLHLEYEKDIDVIDLSRISGTGEGYFKLTYRPDPKLEFPERYIPTSEELLIEEFSNFLQKQYPVPEKDKPFKLFIKWGNELINGKSKEAILEVAFTSTNDLTNKYGPPVNISFVVDKSGSMAGYDRIDALKRSLIEFIKSLRPNDIVSLIAFDDIPEILFESGRISSKKEAYIEEISHLEAGGGTNIYKGMILGYEEVLKNMFKKGTNRVILLTDGYGTTEIDTIVSKSKEYNAKGIDLSAIGVGSGYNQSLLKLLSTKSGGMFQHVGSAENLEESFKRELSSMLYPIATNVSIEIEYNDKIVFSQLYGSEFTKKGNKIIAKVDNIYPAMNKLALIKFDLNKPDKTIESKPVIIRMKYYNYKTQKPEEIIEKTYLKWSEEKGNYELVQESEEKKLYAIAIMNQSLKVMADAFSQDKYIEAQSVIDRTIEQINKLYPNAKQEDVEKLYKTLKNYTNILTQYKKNKLKKS